MLVEEGAVVRRDGVWTATADVRQLAMPATIQALLAARLDQLDDGDRDVAQRAAVVGQVFSRAAAGELCDEQARPTLAQALENLGREAVHRPAGEHDRGRAGLPLQPRARARRGLRGPRQEPAGRAARALRDVARECRQRQRHGARRDPRLPLRAGRAVPARAGRRPRRRARRRAGIRSTRRGGAPGACVRRHPRRCQPPQPCRRHPAGEPPAAAGYPSRGHSGVDRIGEDRAGRHRARRDSRQPSREPQHGWSPSAGGGDRVACLRRLFDVACVVPQR